MKSQNKSKLLVETFASSDEETKALAREFGSKLKPGDIVCLEGDLGAGKTTFVKGLARAFDIGEDEITSPTFTYLHLVGPLAHFDLYRLNNEGEFMAMGFQEYFGAEWITCVEWPGVIDSILPEHYRVRLEHGKGGRSISVSVKASVTKNYEQLII